jgi:hypothetical protein
MKVISGLFLVWMLIACSLTKEKTANSTNVKLDKADEVHASFVTGKVRNRIREGCLYIQVQDGTTEKKYYPINLSDEYKKDGLKIHFLFHLSRAMLPQVCLVDAVDAVIVVDEIELEKID